MPRRLLGLVSLTVIATAIAASPAFSEGAPSAGAPGSWGGVSTASKEAGVVSQARGGPTGSGLWYFEIDPGASRLRWDRYDDVLSSLNGKASWGNPDLWKDGTLKTGGGSPKMILDEARVKAWSAAAKAIGPDQCNPGGPDCLFWKQSSDCPYGSARTYTLGITEAKHPGCYWPGALASFPDFAEIHTFWDDPRADVIAPPDRVAAWNITIWKGPSYSFNSRTNDFVRDERGVAAPIFERRISVCGTNDTDPRSGNPSAAIDAWWRGNTPACIGSGRDFTPNGIPTFEGAFAGPLGAMDNTLSGSGSLAPKLKQCIANRTKTATNDAYAYNRRATVSDVTGTWDGPYASATNRKKGTAIENMIGLGRYACYWNISTSEALYVNYSTAASPAGNGNTGADVGFNWVFTGEIGHWYAIRITAVDTREQLMLTSGSNDTGLGRIFSRNYFEVFVPSPKPFPLSTTPTCPCGAPAAVSSPKLAPLVRLGADKVIPARVRASATVEVVSPGMPSIEQAIFPMNVNLWHFTPQLAYNGARGVGNAYNRDDYVEYDSDVGVRQPSNWRGPSGEQLWVAQLMQPIQADGFNNTMNVFYQTWKRPTLENPCPDPEPSPYQAGAWPRQMNACATADGSAPRNAWDDVFFASVDYETRWIENDGQSTYDMVYRKNDTLRCFAEPGAPARKVAGCEPWHLLYNYTGPYYTTDAALKQYATGYFFAKAPDRGADISKAGATAHIYLKTNRQDLLTRVRMWERGTTTDDPLYQEQSTRNNLNFCKPGLPDGARIATGSEGYASDRLPNATETGDTDCKGPAVSWQWDSPGPGGSSDYSVQDACDVRKPTPSYSQFYAPSYLALQRDNPDALNRIDSWGRYTLYGSPAKYEGNLTGLRGLLREWDPASGQTVETLPYEGNRPGAEAGYDAPGCSKTFGDGRWRTGSWQKTGDWAETYTVMVPQPDKIEKRQEDYQVQVCKNVTTTTGTGKKKKTVTKRVCQTETRTREVTVKVPQPDIAEERVRNHPVYSWQWGNVCLPSNWDAEAITKPRVGKIWTQADQQDYYNAAARPNGDPKARFNEITDFSQNGTCGMSYPGKLQSGRWGISRGADIGFGNNQTGYRLKTGAYNVEWEYGNLSADALANSDCPARRARGLSDKGVCWALTADYDGYNWRWSTQTKSTPWDNGATVALSKVYGFQNSR